ncbi:hypothetical protein [Campylobacter troglodytis]|uniref:hypothetical protein n=1 Tax=Campylobacter troglodytis TaxID=654363 RepID=UPI00163B8AC9|nr:hypothetical protein [Campylobacter troglodytis]
MQDEFTHIIFTNYIKTKGGLIVALQFGVIRLAKKQRFGKNSCKIKKSLNF